MGRDYRRLLYIYPDPSYSFDGIFHISYIASVAKKFSDLQAKMSPAARARSEARARAMLAEMPLQELRLARGLSQETLATTLKVRQASISKLERRTDMYISTLRAHIRAMGGELEIVARFPDGEVKITNFEELGERRKAAA
jgi:DNA-binding XRE family transcriptional regulator